MLPVTKPWLKTKFVVASPFVTAAVTRPFVAMLT